MDITKIIIDTLQKRKRVQVSQIAKKTGFSRVYVHRYFRQLVEQGKIARIGRTDKTHYVLAQKKWIQRGRKTLVLTRRRLINKNLSEDIILRSLKVETGIWDRLSEQTTSALDYAFLELLNNAIEHSRSRIIMVTIQRTTSHIFFTIRDYGVGIFANIRKMWKLNNTMEAIQHLIKGKQTTAPKGHTGQGIFFTSKIAERLIIKSERKKIIFDNLVHDTFVDDTAPTKGTDVRFQIRVKSTTDIQHVFREYSDESYTFNKTTIDIILKKTADGYISRSQARRIMMGLEKFKMVVLDFKYVRVIGQGFADEIFRVWQEDHKGVIIKYQNANENVRFLIEHAKS